MVGMVVLLGLPSYGQGGTECGLVLSGTVLDEHDRSPLPFAEIYVPELDRGVVADVNGKYRIDRLCAGTLTLRVAHVGCEPVEQRIELKADRQLDLFLEHHTEELKELEVVRKRPDENVGQAKHELDKEQMERSSGRSLAEVISGIPGVTMLNSGPTIAKPIINGLFGNRILILNQGVRQEDQQWGSEHAPNMDPFSSDRITVVKGAASVQYGADALGGVVITEPVELPRSSGIGGEIRTVGILNGRGGGVNAMMQGGLGQVRGLGWRVQGSGRYLGDSESPDYVLSNTGLREAGGSAALGYERTKGGATVYYSYFGRKLGILRASHIGNLTDLQNAIASGEPWYVAPFTYDIVPPHQTVAHHLLRTEAHYRTGTLSDLSLTYAYQADDRQEYDIRRGGRSDIPALDLFLATHTADLVLKHFIGTKVHGKAGLSGTLQNNTNVPGTGVRPLIPDYQKEALGAFILEHVPLGPKVELEAGARLEGTRLNAKYFDRSDVYRTPEHRYTNSAFSAGMNWTVRDSTRLRVSVASAFRPPQVSELYSDGLHHGAAAIERGDTTLRSERMIKGTLELDAWWFDRRLHTVVTGHAARMFDYIQLIPQGYELTVRGAFPVFAYTSTEALLYGLDASLSFAISRRISVRSDWSLVRGRDLTNDRWLFLMPPDRTTNALAYTVPQAGHWKDLEISLTSDLVFRQTRYPEALDFTDPPSDYHLLGLSTSVTRPLGNGELRIGLQGTNLLNVAYRDYLDRSRYYADARGIDVVLWLRYRFGK